MVIMFMVKGQGSEGTPPTGVVYDMRMVEHRCLWDSGYPEKPERFTAILERCEELKLLERCHSIPPRFGTEAEILKIHTREHIQKLEDICQKGLLHNKQFDLEKLEEEASHFDYVYFHPSTYDLSLLATGCTIDLVDAVLSNKVRNGMAIIRPPGHHAMKSEFCGYCYFNNVAIAAKNALESGKASRILIVDFDVHHGQATQQAFYDDPRVLYFSTHRYEHGNFWPNLKESDYNFIGSGAGAGFNVNIPLNKQGLGNSEFLSVWNHILLPVAYQFNPDLVIVSAGYDAAVGCFEGEMDVTPQCYPHLIRPLMGLANGKVALVLEGGYCLQSLAEGAALTLRCLLGDPCPLIDPLTEPQEVLVDTILNSAYMLQRQWTNLSSVTFAPANSSALKESDSNVHIPKVHFDWNDPPPVVHLTRDCYPVQSEEIKRSVKERLDQLTKKTSLAKAKFQVCLSVDAELAAEFKTSSAVISKQTTTDRDHLAQVYRNNALKDTILEMSKTIVDGTAQSGVVYQAVTDNQLSMQEVAQSILKRGKLNRVMVLNVNGKVESEGYVSEPQILHLTISTDGGVPQKRDIIPQDDGQNICIPYSTGSIIGDREILAAVTKLVLPVGYQYAPELVLIVTHVDEFDEVTAAGFSHMVHLLSALANGKLIFIATGTGKPGNASKVVQSVTRTLLGKPLEKPEMSREVNGPYLESLQETLRIQAKNWSILSPFARIVPEYNELLVPEGKY